MDENLEKIKITNRALMQVNEMLGPITDPTVVWRWQIRYETPTEFTWLDPTTTAPSNAYISYLIECNKIRDLRAVEYPPMSDYLDGLVKGDQDQIQNYISKCLAVKLKYPFPEPVTY